MIKHSTSHGFAVLGSTIVSALIVEVIKPLLPGVYKWMGKMSERILSYIPVSIPVKYFTILLIATILGFLWGAFFKSRFDR